MAKKSFEITHCFGEGVGGQALYTVGESKIGATSMEDNSAVGINTALFFFLTKEFYL